MGDARPHEPGQTRPGADSRHAEEYGRAARALDDPTVLETARDKARRAGAGLHVPNAGMFRTHPGENRVDGVGLLFLALIEPETDKEVDLGGMSS